MFQKTGKPNKSQSTPKRPTGNVSSRIGSHTGKTNRGKSQPVVKSALKGRMK